MGSKKKGKLGKKPKKRLAAAGVPVHLVPVMIPLLELFSTVDDVLDEHNAFSPGNIHKSLGRIYRSWLDTREALDPDFDRAKYRHEMKSRKSKPTTPLGRERPASGSRRSSTDPTSISGKSRKKSGKPESKSARTSAPDAPSADRASGGRSKKGKSGAYGEGSRTGNGKGSGSGSRAKGTGKSRKAKD